MAKNISELLKKVDPEVKARAVERAALILAEMDLTEFRESLGMTQSDYAALLDVQQSSISKFEKRTDVSISKLREYLAAAGAKLQVTAKFEDGREVHLSQFESA